ncbi:MAG TPA: tRNA lysidine(34) synthetase TilS [Candidatus Angelobacter sp.]
MVEKVLRYIQEQRLIVPGDRVAVAVSGGADSVALLRALLELRGELGAVLAVAHFNHKIRGAEADADEQFVRQLAQEFQMQFYCGSADAPAYAREQKMSLETAARELRHAWFAELVHGNKADKIATAHTQDDQAETVLMRILRGTGTRGLAGIAPRQVKKSLIRPLLSVTRHEVEEFMKHLEQSWRDDSSNTDLRHVRNRVRHELMPVLQRDYNPALRQTLADIAEVARAEEDYWEKELIELKARLVRSGKPSRSGRSNRQELVLAVDLSAFVGQPLAVQRRLLRAIAEDLGATLEFKHIQEVLELARRKKAGLELELPSGLVARNSMRELQLTRDGQSEGSANYSYSLGIPGEVRVAELGTIVRTRIISLEQFSGYNSGLLNRALLAPELKVRNWRPGDRFFPAHTRSPKKVKELLQPGRMGRELSPSERKHWPVVESAGEIVWMRGFRVPEALSAKPGEAVLIEEVEIA